MPPNRLVSPYWQYVRSVRVQCSSILVKSTRILTGILQLFPMQVDYLGATTSTVTVAPPSRLFAVFLAAEIHDAIHSVCRRLPVRNAGIISMLSPCQIRVRILCCQSVMMPMTTIRVTNTVHPKTGVTGLLSWLDLYGRAAWWE